MFKDSKLFRYSRLGVLALSLLWLVINLPFIIRPAFKDILSQNPNYEIFLWIKFLAYSLVVLLVNFVINNLNKEFLKKWDRLLLFSSSLLYSFFRTLKTFDVTDTGFHFTKSWGILHNSFQTNIDFMWAYSLINGLWLKIFGSPNILWARFGWVLVVSLSILFSYKILKIFFPETKTLIITWLVSFLFIHYNYYLSVNYDNLPVLVSLIGAYFLLKEGDKNLKNLFLVGLLFGLTFWIKFNYILIFSFPFIYYLVKCGVLGEDLKSYFKPILSLVSGSFVALIIGFIFLFSTGSFSSYTSYLNKNIVHRNSELSTNQKDVYNKILNFQANSLKDTTKTTISDSLYSFLPDSLAKDSLRTLAIYKADGDGHSLKNLFNGYFIKLWQVLTKSIIFFTIVTIGLYSLGFIKKKFLKNLLLLILGFTFFYYNKLYLGGMPSTSLTAVVFVGYLYILLFKREKKFLELFITIALISLFSFPGSDLAFNVIYRSGAGILLATFPIVYLFDKKFKYKEIKLNFKYFSIFAIFLFLFSTFFPWGYNNSHRDLDRRDLLITPFKSKQLLGIHSTPQRVEVVDELLIFFEKEKYERNETNSLCVGWIPMFYYLTQTNCLYDNPWDSCVPFKEFKEVLENSRENPQYIIIATKFTRNDPWPLMDKEYRKRDSSWIMSLRHIDYTRYYANKHGYKKVFENKMFEVWKIRV